MNTYQSFATILAQLLGTDTAIRPTTRRVADGRGTMILLFDVQQRCQFCYFARGVRSALLLSLLLLPR
jgi:hypothetical protein